MPALPDIGPGEDLTRHNFVVAGLNPDFANAPGPSRQVQLWNGMKAAGSKLL